jgi:hypothetical protein
MPGYEEAFKPFGKDYDSHTPSDPRDETILKLQKEVEELKAELDRQVSKLKSELVERQKAGCPYHSNTCPECIWYEAEPAGVPEKPCQYARPPVSQR